MPDQDFKNKLSTWAQRGAAIDAKDKVQISGRMCSDCAFKKGGAANSEEHNVEAAMTALCWEGKFNCHAHDNDGKLIDAGTACRGFMYAKIYLESL